LLYSSILSYISIYQNDIDKGITLYSGLYNYTSITNIFNNYIYIITIIILHITGFYPRKILNKYSAGVSKLLKYFFFIFTKKIFNKTGEQYRIIEYSLLLLFTIIGAVFLISTNDLISIFLSIELQSYGLYILSTLYRNSESATSAGLTYFLLGGLSSCFILLGASYIYINSGTTSLESIYIITSISNTINQNNFNILY
jgi:NADH-ubiquinone oxidoreductase chain 2